MMSRHVPVSSAAGPALAYLRSSAKERGPRGERLTPIYPFVTISRQAGVDGAGLAHRVSECLNVGLPPGQRQWSVFDQELVDRVAADHHISHQLVEMLEHSNRTWLEEFFRGMSSADRHAASDLTVVRSLISTVRALAQAGLVVLVGRGSALITHDMPGGLHIRLVAPLQKRIEMAMRLYQEPEEQAAEHVRRLDVDRIAFYRRYWPQHSLTPETFSATLNAGSLSPEQMTVCVVDLLKQ